MNVLVVGGFKGPVIVNAVSKKFEDRPVKFSVAQYIEDAIERIRKGEEYDRILVIEPAWTKDGEEDEDRKIRERLFNFSNAAIDSKLVNTEYVFITDSPESSNRVYEEVIQIYSNSAVVCIQTDYSVTMVKKLVLNEVKLIDNYDDVKELLDRQREEELRKLEAIEEEEGELTSISELDLVGDDDIFDNGELSDEMLSALEDLEEEEDEEDENSEGFEGFDNSAFDNFQGLDFDSLEDEEDTENEETTDVETAKVSGFRGMDDEDEEDFEGFDNTDFDSEDTFSGFGGETDLKDFEGVTRVPVETDEDDIEILEDVEDTEILEEEEKEVESAFGSIDWGETEITLEEEEDTVETEEDSEELEDELDYEIGVDLDGEEPKEEEVVSQLWDKPVKTVRDRFDSNEYEDIKSDEPMENSNIDLSEYDVPQSRKKKKRKNSREIDYHEMKIRLDAYATRGTSIVVTGSAGSGKTVVAYNIANTLSNIGHNVLVVDMDTKGRGQSYITKENYRCVDIDGAGLIQALKNGNKANAFVSVARPGLSLLTNGVGGTPVGLVDIVSEENLLRFISSTKSTYNFIIYDIPFNEAVTSVKDVVYAADTILLVTEANQYGMSNTILNMANIEDLEVASTMFTKSKIVFNKGTRLDKVFGRKVKGVEEYLKVMDEIMTEWAGEDTGVYFQDLEIVGYFELDHEIEKSWFGVAPYSGKEPGKGKFIQLLWNTL